MADYQLNAEDLGEQINSNWGAVNSLESKLDRYSQKSITHKGQTISLNFHENVITATLVQESNLKQLPRSIEIIKRQNGLVVRPAGFGISSEDVGLLDRCFPYDDLEKILKLVINEVIISSCQKRILEPVFDSIPFNLVPFGNLDKLTDQQEVEDWSGTDLTFCPAGDKEGFLVRYSQDMADPYNLSSLITRSRRFSIPLAPDVSPSKVESFCSTALKLAPSCCQPDVVAGAVGIEFFIARSEEVISYMSPTHVIDNDKLFLKKMSWLLGEQRFVLEESLLSESSNSKLLGVISIARWENDINGQLKVYSNENPGQNPKISFCPVFRNFGRSPFATGKDKDFWLNDGIFNFEDALRNIKNHWPTLVSELIYPKKVRDVLSL
jgi:hypothetical protein